MVTRARSTRVRRGPAGRAHLLRASTALALVLAGAGGASLASADPGAPAGPDAARTVAPSAAEQATPDDVAEDAPAEVGVLEVEVTNTGRVRKRLGEPAGLAPEGSRSASFQITLDSIEVLTGCPGRGVTLAPENGYFVVIDLAASVDFDVVETTGADVFMPLVADSFGVLGPDGAPQAAPTEASWGCYEDDQLAPPFVGAGESAAGKVVLDSAVPAGTLVYTPGGSTGWEWSFER